MSTLMKWFIPAIVVVFVATLYLYVTTVQNANVSSTADVQVLGSTVNMGSVRTAYNADGEQKGTQSTFVTGQASEHYNQNGYSGELTKYVASGEYVPSESKYVDNQSNQDYDKDGYVGTLDKYLVSGKLVEGDKKYVTNQTEKEYALHGYTGTLTEYQVGGEFIPGDKKYVTNVSADDYSSKTYEYDRGVYSGTLKRYVIHGEYVPGDTKFVDEQQFKDYNDGEYSGTLKEYKRESYIPSVQTGENLISNSYPFKSDYYWYFTKEGYDDTGNHYFNDGALGITGYSNGWKQWQVSSETRIGYGLPEFGLKNLKEGKTYRLSFETRRVSDVTKDEPVRLILRNGEGDENNIFVLKVEPDDITHEWAQYSGVITIPSGSINKNVRTRFIMGFNGTGTIEGRNFSISPISN